MVSSPSLAPPAETVLTFLESIGLGSEGEFYVRLFRQLPKESFAVILLTASAARHGLGVVADELRFLAHLGLYAPVVFGGADPRVSARAAEELRELLGRSELEGPLFAADGVELVSALRQELSADRMPIVTFGRAASSGERMARVADVALGLGARKLVLLRERGGLRARREVPGGPILEGRARRFSVLNLATDRARLEADGVLSQEDRATLGLVVDFCQRTAGKIPVNVASPLNLLRELFTVKGAGTFVRAGSEVQRFGSYAELDRGRLQKLIESSFGRALRTDFFETPPLAVYLEANYRAAAIVHPGGPAPVLSKFAVEREAQGEGLGQDLWQRLRKDHTALVWRARPDNSINSWYRTVADGMHRTADWVVFWRGIAVESVPSAVRWMETRVKDFPPVTSPNASR